QLTSSGEYRAFFGHPGEVIYMSADKPAHVMRMNEDGSGRRAASDLAIRQLQSVSPSGRWAIVGATPPGDHGERATVAMAVPLGGGQPVSLWCDSCSF